MTDALLIAAVLVALLACPLMALMGRRGIGPGCAAAGCPPKRDDETLEGLRTRQRQLDERIARLEATERAPAAIDR